MFVNWDKNGNPFRVEKNRIIDECMLHGRVRLDERRLDEVQWLDNVPYRRSPLRRRPHRRVSLFSYFWELFMLRTSIPISST